MKISVKLFFHESMQYIYPVDTGRKLNDVQKTYVR